MDKLDISPSRFEKLEEFDWWYFKQIQPDAGMQFTSKDFMKVFLYAECNLH